MRIVLGDLRHSTVGRHSAYIPIAIGYIASFAKSQLGPDEIHVSIHVDADEISNIIASERPDIVGLSNYIWNAELSAAVGRHTKRVSPASLIVAGGPEFPRVDSEIVDYLTYRNDLDFFVSNFEGEVSFAELVKAVRCGRPLAELKQDPPPGITCLDGEGRLRQSASPPRLKEMDVIPSPILTGMMERFLNGEFMPFIETTRGCPYACAYCVQGVDWFNKVAGFSSERVSAELTYIAQRMRNFPDIPLAMADSNFGMFQRDEETADIIRQMQDSYGWPRSFIVDTGKSQLQRLLRVAEKLNRQISMSISPQSLNPDTLHAIKRKNLGDGNLIAVYEEFKKRNITTNAAIIVPLPEETKRSYIDGLRKLSESNVEQPLAYTTMLLKGTPLASVESRKKYAMRTMYRLLPRQFGEYFGSRVFEFDEVCIETNTMTHGEYVECRSVVFAFLVLSHKQFDMYKLHCAEYGLPWFDFLLEYWEAARKDSGRIGRLFKEYEDETKGELYESPEAIRRFLSDDANYAKLLEGERGDNLIRKLSPKMVYDEFAVASALGYDILERQLPDRAAS